MTSSRRGGEVSPAPRRSRGIVGEHWSVHDAPLSGDFPEIVCLDLEATGLSSAVDHVIEIGAVKFRGAEVVDRFHTLVNPGLRLPSMIRRLTGINDEDLERAPRLREVVPRLGAFIGSAHLLAHGADYDMSFLEETIGPAALDHRHVYDTIHVARVVCPAAPSYSLGGLCDLVGLDHPRPHRALEDAEATFRLFVALLRLARQLPATTLLELRRMTEGSDHSIAAFFHELVGAGEEAERPLPAQAEPLSLARRTAEPELEALDADTLAALLGPGGPLGSEPGWELRESQQEMCRAVAQAFDRRLNLVVEAGTGTGKSLAYLVPSLAFAISRRRQVCVSTYTINLQEQLLHKDLPLAARILGVPLRAALLKGRSHYLSRRRWEQLVAASPNSTLEGVDAGELLIFKLKLAVWLGWTTTGDRDELRLFGQEERAWRAVASEWGECRAEACLAGSTPCFYHRARGRAAEADVVVVNHALLLADAFNEAGSLAAARYLVLDEAHHLEEAATNGLTEEVREDDVLGLISVARAGHRQGPSPSLGRLTDGVLRVFDLLRMATREAFGQENGRELRIDGNLRQATELMLAGNAVAQALAGLTDAEAAVVGSRIERLVAILGTPRPDTVTWAGFGRDGRAALRRAPLEVGQLLNESLFADRESVVFTGATLAVGGSFDFFRSRIGLPESRLFEVVLPSPFDFLKQALVCIPDDIPLPPDDGFEVALADVVAGIATALRGKTLVLFTSSEMLQVASDLLRQRLDGEGIEVLAQGRGAGSRRVLTERFVGVKEAVLCGTNSFWEGLDLPGKSLSCVVIVRLPFAPPGDPVVRARGERMRDPFVEMALPEAVLRLRQGFGRLVRRASDRGAVVILDRRVAVRAYGEHFLSSLPECARYTGPADTLPAAVLEWVEERGLSFSHGGPGGEPAEEAGAGAVRAEPG